MILMTRREEQGYFEQRLEVSERWVDWDLRWRRTRRWTCWILLMIRHDSSSHMRV